MNAFEADRLLDSVESIFLKFGSQFGAKTKSNTHYDAVNRELKWQSNGLLKKIDLEYDYAEEPSFTLYVVATKKPTLFNLSFLGKSNSDSKRWMQKLASVKPPFEEQKIFDLLKNAKQILDRLTSSSVE